MMLFTFSSFYGKYSFLGKFGSKNQNCQFKLKFGIKTNSNIQNSMVIVLTVCSYHVTYPLQSESTVYNCLTVKELLAQIRREIWSLSDCNWTRTHNHLVHKRTLNHLAKLAKWLSVCSWTKLLWVWVQLQSLQWWCSIFCLWLEILFGG